MKAARRLEQYTSLPLVIMVAFTAILFFAMFVRVYNSDRDHARLNLETIQAELASQAGVHHAFHMIQKLLEGSELPKGTGGISSEFLSSAIITDRWINAGTRTSMLHRITSVRVVNVGLDSSDALIPEDSVVFEVTSEGRSGRRYSKTVAVGYIFDISGTFAVFNSLNEYYYGQPLRHVASTVGLDQFISANRKLFDSGQITLQGIIHNPQLLFSVYGSDEFPFSLPQGSEPPTGFGKVFKRDGIGPALGPLYCETPIIVDSHTFRGRIQTASYIFRRSQGRPAIGIDNTMFALPSSLRIQQISNNLEGGIPKEVVIDRDTQPRVSYVRRWHPDFNFLRRLAKASGIYINSSGKAFMRGAPSLVDYHIQEHNLVSDDYTLPTRFEPTIDRANEKSIVLSTATRYEGYNNLSSSNINGAKILFSEYPIFIRGDIEDDLIIVTPRQIFITGPLNDEYPKNLFLIGGEGIAVSTVDLENYIIENDPDPSFLEAAMKWTIYAVMYKPGAGIYSKARQPEAMGQTLTRLGMLHQRDFELTIRGSCIEGNLQRWINMCKPDGVTVQLDSSMLRFLPYRPLSANLLRMKTIMEN